MCGTIYNYRSFLYLRVGSRVQKGVTRVVADRELLASKRICRKFKATCKRNTRRGHGIDWLVLLFNCWCCKRFARLNDLTKHELTRACRLEVIHWMILLPCKVRRWFTELGSL
eukprot:Pompholyxophrys_punicea_v1_NODE_143_length_3211_cov_4.433777.p3 type:complete len:113 gc:universal NODE_143_length_3211_cov_4.433777:2446-2784(+)